MIIMNRMKRITRTGPVNLECGDSSPLSKALTSQRTPKKLLLIAVMVLSTAAAITKDRPLFQSVADTVITIWKDYPGAAPGRPARWTYEQGVVLRGMEEVWKQTRDRRYYDYIQQTMDRYVTDDGAIRTYKTEEYQLDNILLGRMLLFLYKETKQEKYRKAADLLRDQLRKQPRTSEGGFWHKQIYPSQMWLDGLYMAGPFYAEYARIFHEDTDFDDIAKQFILIERHTRDPKTGLLYHGWNESRKQRWADPATGHSPNFWGRAMGWYAMALVDTLDYFPPNHPQRNALIAILKRLANAVAKYQDDSTGLWYQVVDRAGVKGNYFESSAAAMFVYALAKGARENYLPASYFRVAEKGYGGMLKQFIQIRPDGMVDFNGTVSVAGLGGNPYRDGSYEYYLSEKVVTNDPKGVGALLLAATEMARSPVKRKR
jgi:unsaturated rhamnogalacturonyl hydrolase